MYACSDAIGSHPVSSQNIDQFLLDNISLQCSNSLFYDFFSHLHQLIEVISNVLLLFVLERLELDSHFDCHSCQIHQEFAHLVSIDAFFYLWIYQTPNGVTGVSQIPMTTSQES